MAEPDGKSASEGNNNPLPIDRDHTEDLPPPPVSHSVPPSWRRRLFGYWKWPGWGAITLGGTRVFHLGEDIDFALGVVRSLGGSLGMIAAALASPFFAVGLVAYGVAHLIFVGEPRLAVRSRAWVYAGWFVVTVCLSAVVGTAIWGGIQAYIAKQVAIRTTDQFWHLTEDQKQRLGEELDRVPSEQRFPIALQIVMANAQALTISEDLADVFKTHGWIITGSQDMRLRADLLGINFVMAADQPRTDKDAPPHSYELASIFQKASINYRSGFIPGFDNNSLVLAIGSRPPEW